MPKDIQTKISKKSSSTKKKEEASRLRRRKDESSDSDFVSDDDDEDEEMDMQEYREFLAKTFPSKHLDKKVKAGNKLKEVLEEEPEPMNKDKRTRNIKKNKIVEESEDMRMKMKNIFLKNLTKRLLKNLLIKGRLLKKIVAVKRKKIVKRKILTNLKLKVKQASLILYLLLVQVRMKLMMNLMMKKMMIG